MFYFFALVAAVFIIAMVSQLTNLNNKVFFGIRSQRETYVSGLSVKFQTKIFGNKEEIRKITWLFNGFV